MSEAQIRKAEAADYDNVTALLRSASLPIEGVAEHFRNFVVAEIHQDIIGAIGLEVYGETALLRSAVVHQLHRNIGVGSQLFTAVLELARGLVIRRLILLTDTAEEFFQRKGFRSIDAKSVVGAVTSSVEFTGSCPSTAVCMELTL